MKFKAIAAAVICATSSLCAPAVVVTPSLTSVNDVTIFDMIDRLMARPVRKARPASSPIQPVMGYAEQLHAFKNSLNGYSESFMPWGLFNDFRKPGSGTSAVTRNVNQPGDVMIPVNFTIVAAISGTQEKLPETGYPFMLLTGLAVMGAIAMRRGGGQGA